MSIGVFAGSFDPFTLGHYEIVRRAAALFDTLYIGVARSSGSKICKASPERRSEIVLKSVEDLKNVQVKIFDGFLTDFASALHADCIVRGLRTSLDFEYEKSLMEVYKSQSGIECVYIISAAAKSHISGAVVRDLISLKGNLEGYVCASAQKLIGDTYSK